VAKFKFVDSTVDDEEDEKQRQENLIVDYQGLKLYFSEIIKLYQNLGESCV
jgi:hypothetical protein